MVTGQVDEKERTNPIPLQGDFLISQAPLIVEGNLQFCFDVSA